MRAKKFGAMAMAMAMAATMMPMSTFAQEEETYDFGGAEVRVFGNKWNDLDPDAEGDKTQYLDAAAQVEEKYNIKFVYAKPDGYDGYNLGELIQAGITAGDAGVDILDSEPDALISLLSSGALTDLTNDMDQIHVGSLYKEAVTWQDHCYGMTFDNVGDTYFMVYSRDYLEEIGMDVTPTEKFMAGEWSYDDMKEYLTEMKAKLPEGVYTIGIHYYHWASMAAAANGVIQIDSDGNINFNQEGFIEAMSFYKELIDEGLACPIEVEKNEDGDYSDVTCYYSTQDMADQKFVIGRIEAWQAGGLADSIGEWGVTMWPWGSNVTCDGDYTTLSDNYYTAQSYWGSCVIPVTASEKTGIEAIDLMKIANDYYDLVQPSGAAGRLSAWEAEQAGEEPQIGFDAGTARDFCTEEDYELYDWAHNRVKYDWAKPFDNAKITSIWNLAAEIIAEGVDARSAADSAYTAAVEKATEMGLISEQK